MAVPIQQPVNPLIIAEALRRLNAPSENVAAMKIQDQQLRNVENSQRFNRPLPASGAGNAAVAGVANGIAKMLARQRGEKNLDAAYAEYQQAEQMKAAQAAEAAAEADRVKRQRELQDAAWERGIALQDRDAQYARDDARTAAANSEYDRRFRMEQDANGPTEMDAAQLEAQRIANQKARRELNSPATPAPTFQEKEDIKKEAARRAALAESSTSRNANIAKAQKFLAAFENGADSGKMRSAMRFLPTFTEQGEFDEEFNAFAETAARAALKANGETRPTDADVKGMKEAMFGVGRDEEVNKTLLQDFINNMTTEENEYRRLTGREPLGVAPQGGAKFLGVE